MGERGRVCHWHLQKAKIVGFRVGVKSECSQTGRRTMPFSGNRYSFDASTLGKVSQVGAVYGLFAPAQGRPGCFICLYVGQTNDLRARLHEHFNYPPISGVTHFYAEVITTEKQRKLREKKLIAEFYPPGNKTRGG